MQIHESRVHLDIETDDIPVEAARLENLRATVSKSRPPDRLEEGEPRDWLFHMVFLLYAFDLKRPR